ncbi:MAG: MATE family efflux transporter [Leptolyngbyaceae cyanobacterium bins.59]|nr:MATE family efflux transporter [Leptolyngbyaceae cyanobacterium bins.59]
MLTKSRLFTEVRACLLLALPLAGAQLAQSATTFADTVMMGLLGSQTLAAGALGSALFATLLLITTGILTAVSPMVAQAFGAGNSDQVAQTTRHGLWLAVILACLSTIVLWQGGSILGKLGQDPMNVQMAESYLRWITVGALPALVFAVLRNFMTALDRPRPVLVIALMGTIANVTGNYLLMFGKGGLPRMELAGIGLSSALSYWLMVGLTIAYILTDSTLRTYPVFRRLFQVHPTLFRELIHIGWPIGVLHGVEVGLFTATTLLMGWLGTTTLAAHQIALQTIAMTFMVPLGISLATTIRVGQLLGRDRAKDARLAGYVGIGLGSLFMGMMGVVFWFVPQPIIALYVNIQQPEYQPVVQMAAALLGVAAMFQIFDGIQVIAAGALRGLKDTRIPMLIGLFAYWGVGLSSGYTLGIWAGLGGTGLWWGLAFGLAISPSLDPPLRSKI